MPVFSPHPLSRGKAREEVEDVVSGGMIDYAGLA
jgi:hypothetical protein